MKGFFHETDLRQNFVEQRKRKEKKRGGLLRKKKQNI
jgi:hypothetical protein